MDLKFLLYCFQSKKTVFHVVPPNWWTSDTDPHTPLGNSIKSIEEYQHFDKDLIFWIVNEIVLYNIRKPIINKKKKKGHFHGRATVVNRKLGR